MGECHLSALVSTSNARSGFRTRSYEQLVAAAITDNRLRMLITFVVQMVKLALRLLSFS